MIRDPSPKMKWRMARSVSATSSLILFHHPCVDSGLTMRRRRRLFSALVTRQRPPYPGVLPEWSHGYEGERLCLCTSIGGYFWNDGGTKFEERWGGGIVNPWVEAFMEEYINYIKGKAKKIEKRTFSVRGCFDSVDEDKGRPID